MIPTSMATSTLEEEIRERLKELPDVEGSIENETAYRASVDAMVRRIDAEERKRLKKGEIDDSRNEHLLTLTAYREASYELGISPANFKTALKEIVEKEFETKEGRLGRLMTYGAGALVYGTLVGGAVMGWHIASTYDLTISQFRVGIGAGFGAALGAIVGTCVGTAALTVPVWLSDCLGFDINSNSFEDKLETLRKSLADSSGESFSAACERYKFRPDYGMVIERAIDRQANEHRLKEESEERAAIERAYRGDTTVRKQSEAAARVYDAMISEVEAKVRRT